MGTARRSMDVFASQRAARRRTAALLAWFALALAVVIALVYVAVLLPPWLVDGGAERLWRPDALAGVTVGVLAIVGGGVAYHSVALARGGGEALVESLGGVAVERTSTDPRERRLLNVLEEMAVASGLPVPAAYVLPEEDAINALTAGPTPGHAAVAVTRGALARLSRDELQAVVAHELSHVLNADTRLNARLMGMVGGLTILSLLGRETLRLAWPESRASWKVRLVLLPTGLVLAAAGWLGVLGGQLVRCAVSREREFLADAAAAQFTRNPSALAAALLEIARTGSALRAPRSLEASHFFFADPLSARWRRWLSTHPPIAERVRRLDPALGAEADRWAEPEGAAQPLPGAGAVAGIAPVPAGAVAPGASGATRDAAHPDHLARARRILGGLAPELVAAARQAAGGRALVTALRLSTVEELGVAQLGWLERRDAPLADAVRGLWPRVAGLRREERLALLDLALPSLDALAAPDAEALRRDLAELAPDEGAGLFDWMLQRVVARRLERRLSGRPALPVRYRSVEQVGPECLQLLSLLAWTGAPDAARAEEALRRGLVAVGAGAGWGLVPREHLDVGAADSALRQLDLASPEVKRRVLRGCAAAVAADGRLTAAETELLRAVTASLGWPMPSLFPGALRAAAPRPVAPAA